MKIIKMRKTVLTTISMISMMSNQWEGGLLHCLGHQQHHLLDDQEDCDVDEEDCTDYDVSDEHDELIKRMVMSNQSEGGLLHGLGHLQHQDNDEDDQDGYNGDEEACADYDIYDEQPILRWVTPPHWTSTTSSASLSPLLLSSSLFSSTSSGCLFRGMSESSSSE